MKVLKFVLGVTVLLSVGVIGGTVYLLPHATTEQFTTELASSTPEVSMSSTTDSGVPSAPVPLLEKPVIIDITQLPESQKKVLEVLGVEEQTFTITPGMVACAVQALGSARVTEIQKGTPPSLTEGLTLLTCIKK